MSTKERKLREKNNRKELILNAAENIMEKVGLYGLSIELIAEETQLAKGTIYLYFKSKEEILSSLTIKARKKLLDQFRLVEKSEVNPYNQLIALITTSYSFYKQFPLHYDLVSLYEANHKVAETEEMYQSSQDITDFVYGIVERAQEGGYIKSSINRLQFTMVMWGMTVGVLQLIKVRGSLLQENLSITEVELIQTFVSSFFEGIKP